MKEQGSSFFYVIPCCENTKSDICKSLGSILIQPTFSLFFVINIAVLFYRLESNAYFDQWFMKYYMTNMDSMLAIYSLVFFHCIVYIRKIK